MSKIETNTIDTISGSATMQIGSTNTSTINLGVSGDTINVPSGVTIANAGTATGFASPFYSCGVWKQTATGIADSTWTKWNTVGGTELWDKGNIMDLSNSRITVPSDAAGVWVFKCAVKNENYASARMLIRFYKNGSDTEALGGTQEIGPLASGSYPTCQIVHYFSLAAGDYIEPYVRQSSGSSQNMYDFFYSAAYLGVAS